MRHGEFLTEVSLQTLGREGFYRLWEWLLGSLVLSPVYGHAPCLGTPGQICSRAKVKSKCRPHYYYSGLWFPCKFFWPLQIEDSPSAGGCGCNLGFCLSNKFSGFWPCCGGAPDWARDSSLASLVQNDIRGTAGKVG